MMQGKSLLKNWLIYLHQVSAHVFVRKNGKRENVPLLVKPLGLVQLQTLFQHIDGLHSLVAVAKTGLVTEPVQVQAYIFHISRSLIQIREQAYHLLYRLNQSSENDEIPQDETLKLVLATLHKCQQTILSISHILETQPIINVINNDKFIIMVNTLELNAVELSSHMRRYNQFCAQKDTLNALFELETLLTDKSSLLKYHASGFKERYEVRDRENFFSGLSDEVSSELMKKLAMISDPIYTQFAKEIIDIYLGLKKCYVVSRKSVINNTLNNISDDIESLMNAIRNIDECKDDALSALHAIYCGLESIRFSTNTESRCSRNLFEKSKQARTKLRQACQGCDIGLIFLEQISLKKLVYASTSNKK